MDVESDDETDIQDIDLINSVLEKDRVSIEASSQCSISTSTTATAPCVGLPRGPRIEVALALNKLTEEKLQRLENILIARLAECREKLLETQRAGKEQKPVPKSSTFLSLHCGKPYFKDKNFYPAPDNSDTILMKNTGIYDVVSVTSVSGWTVKDKRKFIEVILELSRGIKKRQLHSYISQCQREAKTLEDDKEIEPKLSVARHEINSLDKKNLAEVALPIEEEYDWDIVAGKLNYRHTPTEYRALWRLFLHPSINKSSWTQREHTKLQSIATQYKYQDWDEIANELGTGRTGYQCFVYYRTNMSNKFSSNRWSVEEEEYLKRLIEYYRQDNYIPWRQIVPKMSHRTKLQMYNKYLRLTEKKGRFLAEEDAVLLTCVEKYGTNWKLITKYLNGRSVSQIRTRYENLSKKTKRISCVWTVEEDKRLIQLMANQEAGSYAEIVDKFPGKDRTNIRSRHLILIKWMKHYPRHDIECAPRRGARRLMHGQVAGDLTKALNNLKTRMSKQYDSNKKSKVTIASSEEAIEHSIMVTLMNEKFLDYHETDVPSTSNGPPLSKQEENVVNLRKVLILLKSSLNKNEFTNSTCAKYKDLLETDYISIPLRSYSKKPQKIVSTENSPDIWGGIKLTNTNHVLPPNFSTIIGCKQLLMKYSNNNSQAAKVMNKINILRRKNSIFKQQFEQLMDRFQTLFLWPMLISNKQPRPPGYYNQIIPNIRTISINLGASRAVDTRAPNVATHYVKKLSSKADYHDDDDDSVKCLHSTFGKPD